MKKMKRVLIAFATVLVLFVACKKEKIIDPRDQMIGVYTATVTATIQYSKVPELGMGDEVSLNSVTIKVDKGTAADEIVVTELDASSGNTIYKLNAVTISSNGATFNIPSQTIVSGGYSTTIIGYTNFTLGSAKYDGGYIELSKNLKYGYSGRLMINGITLPFTTSYSATKQ